MRPSSRTFVACLVSAGLAFTGCATSGTVPAKPTPLQIRSMQIRDFSGVDKKTVTQAAMNLLQDEGYIISQGDSELGFLSARRELDLRKPAKPLTAGQIAATVGIVAAIGTALVLIAKNNKRSNDDTPAATEPVPSSTVHQDRTQVTECTVMVTPFGDGTRVRANFEQRVINDAGQATQNGPLRDAEVYQNFFQKLDKSLFLEKETVAVSTTPA
jgi:hypothetical protein